MNQMDHTGLNSFWANGEGEWIKKLSEEYETSLCTLEQQKRDAKDDVTRLLVEQQINTLKQNFDAAVLSAQKSLW